MDLSSTAAPRGISIAQEPFPDRSLVRGYAMRIAERRPGGREVFYDFALTAWLEITPDLLVHLACQAEYGTGVRAGSLD